MTALKIIFGDALIVTLVPMLAVATGAHISTAIVGSLCGFLCFVWFLICVETAR